MYYYTVIKRKAIQKNEIKNFFQDIFSVLKVFVLLTETV